VRRAFVLQLGPETDPQRRLDCWIASPARNFGTTLMPDPSNANRLTISYVMELLDRFDLQALIERFGPVPAERAVHLLQQVCHSITFPTVWTRARARAWWDLHHPAAA
jgi:hypothetical protein